MVMNGNVLRVVVGIGIFAATAFGMIYACASSETPSTSFATYEDASKQGATGAGKWLPSWLPKGATEIREAHSVDTNLVWLEFQGAKALSEFGPQCRPIDHRAMKKALPELSRGFPQFMRDSRERLVVADETEAAQCADEHVKHDWIAVLSKGGGAVYAWTLP
jgi:hypothetical protein